MRGHVRKRGRSWSVVVDVGRDDTGKRRQKWVSGFKTKGEADDALVDLLGKVRRGEVIDPDTTPLSEYLTAWLDGRTGELAPLSVTQKARSARTGSRTSSPGTARQPASGRAACHDIRHTVATHLLTAGLPGSYRVGEARSLLANGHPERLRPRPAALRRASRRGHGGTARLAHRL
jgi:integrase